MMDLRSAFFSPKNRKTKRLDLEMDGAIRTVELRACSLAMREKILALAKDADSVRGMQRAAAMAVQVFAYYPDDYSDDETGRSKAGTKMFPDADSTLLYGDVKDSHPEAAAAAELVGQIARAALEMLNGSAAPTCSACGKPRTPGHVLCGFCGERFPTTVEQSLVEVAEKNSKTTPSKP